MPPNTVALATGGVNVDGFPLTPDHGTLSAAAALLALALIPRYTLSWLCAAGGNVDGFPVTFPHVIVSCPPTCSQAFAALSNQIFFVSVAIYSALLPDAVPLSASRPTVIFVGVNPSFSTILAFVSSLRIVAADLFSTFPSPRSVLVVPCGFVPLPG